MGSDCQAAQFVQEDIANGTKTAVRILKVNDLTLGGGTVKMFSDPFLSSFTAVVSLEIPSYLCDGRIDVIFVSLIDDGEI